MYPYLIGSEAAVQLIGIVAIFVCLIAADYISARIHRKRASVEYQRSEMIIDFERLVGVILSIIVFFVPIFHIVLAGDAPILHIFDIYNNLGEAREGFVKLLMTSYFVKVLFAWHTSIISTILFSYLVVSARYRFAAVVAIWAILYAVLSLARLPALMFLFISVFVIAYYGHSRFHMFVPRLAAVGMALFVFAGMYRGEVLLDFYAKLDPSLITEQQRAAWDKSLAGGIPVSPSDIERLETTGVHPRSSFGYIGDYAIYRAFLSPVEVANRWYGFFPNHSNGWRSGYDLVSISRAPDWKHAANRVAEWAYVARFPSRYLGSAHAYASADADAYSFGGLIGIAISAGLLFFVRVLIALLAAPIGISRIVYLVCLALLTVLPFQASLQAILLSHGVLVLLAALAGLNVLSNAVKRFGNSASSVSK